MLKATHQWIAILTGISVLMAVTNPKQQDYTEHITALFQNTVCQQSELPTPIQLLCRTSVVLPRNVTKQWVLQYSWRKDYIFFSLYRTNLWGLQHQSIGIGGCFFPVNFFPFPIEAESREDNSTALTLID
jgi:hypothetical protein